MATDADIESQGNKNGKKQGEMESVGGKFAVFLSFVSLLQQQ
jgi:hypothetical protein